jgi:toxin ParE1/3/4
MIELQWAPEGRTDLDEFYDHICRRELQPALADQAVRRLMDSCRSLAEAASSGSPSGTERPDFGDDVRIFAHQQWVIFFRPIKNGIEVLRILDGSDGFAQVFGD